MFRVNIHGVPFLGNYNEHHYKSLFRVAEVTTKDEWNGITGVYSNDGYEKPSEDNFSTAGQYARWSVYPNKKATVEIDYRNGIIEKISPYDSPIIFMNGRSLQREEDYVFTLLHELGHHVNRKAEESQDKKDREIGAHTFALDKYFKIYRRLKVKQYTYLEEALKEYGIKNYVEFKEYA